MNITKLAVAVLVSLGSPSQSYAQVVLDRTDPTQGEEDEVRQPENDDGVPPAIAVDQESERAVSGESYSVGAIILSLIHI